MKKLIPFLLIGIIILSGCLSQKRVGNGVISSELIPDVTSTQAGSPVGVILRIDNQAKNPIKDVDASLYGSSEWKIDGKDITTAVYHANIIPSLNSMEKVWVVAAPKVDITTAYRIFAKVDYNYEFNRDVLLNLVTFDYFKRTKTKPSFTLYPSKLDGPIGVEFGDLDNIPYIYETNEPTVFSIKVFINNVGLGRAYRGEPKVNLGLDRVKVSIVKSSNIVRLKDCTPDLISSSENRDEFIVDLIDEGTHGIISCNVEVPQGFVTDLNTVRLSVRVEYSYI
jgi:hypothetical protein